MVIINTICRHFQQKANIDLVSTGVIDTTHGGQIVVTAAAANLVGKAAFAALLGNRELVARIAGPFAVSAVAAAGVVWFL